MIFSKDFLESEAFQTVDNNAIILYMILRAQEKYYGKTDYKKMEKQSGLNEFTVKRHYERLKILNWIKEEEGKKILLKTEEGYLLDLILKAGVKKYQKRQDYEEKKKKKTVKDVEKRIIEENKAIAAARIAKSAGVKPQTGVVNKNVRALWRRFTEIYEITYDEKCKIFGDRKVLAYMKRPLAWSNFDFDYVEKVMEFLFENWQKLKGPLGMKDPRPTISVLGSNILWNRLREFYDNGLGPSIRDRVSHEKVHGDEIDEW